MCAQLALKIHIRAVEEMGEALRVHDRGASAVLLSEALDHQNRVFQLAHVVCLLELSHLLERLTAESGITSATGLARCQVELANYFAAALLMPYDPLLAIAEGTRYDVDRIAAAFASRSSRSATG